MRAALAIMGLCLVGCGRPRAESGLAVMPSRWYWTAEQVEAEMVKALADVGSHLRSPRLMATFYVRDQAEGAALLRAARVMPGTNATLLAPGVDSLVPAGFSATVHEPPPLWHVRLTSTFAPSDRDQLRSWVQQLCTLAPGPPRTLGSFGIIDAPR